MARIFLCHASEDKAQVREVYRQLKALGFEPWLDEVDILAGKNWNFADSAGFSGKMPRY